MYAATMTLKTSDLLIRKQHTLLLEIAVLNQIEVTYLQKKNCDF